MLYLHDAYSTLDATRSRLDDCWKAAGCTSAPLGLRGRSV